MCAQILFSVKLDNKISALDSYWIILLLKSNLYPFISVFLQNLCLLCLFLCTVQLWLEISSIDNWFGPHYDSRIRGPSTVTSRVTPRSRNRDPEYCLLSEEWDPFQKNLQRILAFFTFGGHGDSMGLPMFQFCRSLVYTSIKMLLILCWNCKIQNLQRQDFMYFRASHICVQQRCSNQLDVPAAC